MFALTLARLNSLWDRLLGISSFGSKVALTMLTNVFLSLLSVVSGVLAARLLGPIGRGQLAAIQTWPIFLTVFALLGIPDALAYFSAREPERAARWLSTAMLLALLASGPFALIGYWLMPSLLGAQTSQVIEAAQVYLWTLPIAAVVGLLLHPLRGRNDLLFWNLLRPMPSMVWIGVLLLALILNISSPVILSRAYLLALAILGLPIGYIVIRRVPGSYSPSSTLIKPMLQYGLPLVLSSVPATLNLRLDQVLMAGLLGPQLLGLYVVGVAWSGAVSPLLSAVSASLLPRVAGLHSTTEQARLLAQSMRLGWLLSAILAIVTALTAPLAIPLLFGQVYAQAVPATIILSLAAGVLAFNQLMTAGALSLGQPRIVLLAESAGLVVTMGLLWLLLRPYQLVGAAVASLSSYTVVCGLLLWLMRHQTGLATKELLIPNRSDFKLIFSKWTFMMLRRRALEKSS